MFLGLKRASDSRIVQRVLGGQQDAYAYLVERYMPSVRAIIVGGPVYASDVDDVTQETFLRAYQKLDTLSQPERFGPWLLTIARNTALGWARRYRNPSPLTDQLADEHLVTEPPVDQQDRERVLREALGRIDERSREILTLHYLSGKSLKEIAALLEISRDAAAKRLQRAREALGAELLSAFPEYVPSREKVSASTKAIMAAVATTSVAWQASAQAGAGAATLGAGGALAGGKVAGVAVSLVVAILALLALFRFDVFDPFANSEPPAKVPQIQVDPTPAPVTPPVEAAHAVDEGTVEGELTGNGIVSGIYATQSGHPAVGATVFLERVTWEPWEYPPEDTYKRTGETDAAGKVEFRDLPMGEYGGVAMGDSTGGSEDWGISAERPESHKRSTLMMDIVPFAGHVVDAEGKPVPEAVVYPITHQAFPEDEFRHRLVVPLRAKTDAEGRFEMMGLWPGAWKFYIVQPGGRLHITDFIEAPAEDAELVVPPAPKLTGQVVADRDGIALGGLKLHLHAGQRIRYETVTDASGGFEIPAIGVGEYRVALEDPALTLADNDYRLRVSSDMEGHIEEIRVNTGGTVMGALRDAKSGQGIAGVKLYLRTEGRGLDTVTGPDGGYIFMGLPGGAATITAHQQVKGYVLPGYELSRSVQVPPGDTLEDIDLEMAPAVPLSGVVVDTEGAPVREAKVTASARYNSAREETDLMGRFSASYFAKESTVSVYASVDGWRSETMNITLTEEGKSDLKLTLTEKTDCSLSGNVRTASGRILKGARIQVHKVDEPNSIVASEYASGTGIYELKNLPAGTFVFSIEDQNRYQNIPCEGMKVTLDPGEHREDFELICGGQGSGSIAGRVIDHEGKPVQIAEVRVPDTALTTAADADGFFSIDGLEGDFVDLEVEPFRQTPVYLKDVKVGTKNLVVKVLPRTTVTGKVIAEANRSPLAGAAIRVFPQTPVARTVGIAVTDVKTDEEGLFSAEEMPQGSITVEVKMAGYAPARVQANNPEDIPLQIALTKGGAVEGYVVDPEGRPLGGATIRAYGSGGSGEHYNYDGVTTDEKGYYKLDGIAPDSQLQLTASYPQRMPGKAEATVAGTGTARVDMTIGLSGTLIVLVTHNGVPVPAAHMHVSLYNQVYDSGAVLPMPRIEDGAITYDEIAVGDTRGSISIDVVEGASKIDPSQQLHRTFQDEVVAQEETIVEVAFESGACVIYGTVMLPESIDQVRVLLIPEEGGQTQSRELDSGNAYRFEELVPGRYTVTLYANWDGEMGLRRSQAVELADGMEANLNFNLTNSTIVRGHVAGPESILSAAMLIVPVNIEVARGEAREAYLRTLARSAVAEFRPRNDGTFSVAGLAPGEYNVVAFNIAQDGREIDPSDMTFTTAPLTVPEGGTEDIVLQFE